MLKNIIFDFGAVLVDWNPHYLFDPYFGSREKADWFLANICTTEWNTRMDGGKPFAEGVAELSALHPEWAEEISLYWTGWKQMMGSTIPGMPELVAELRAKGYGLYGLTNWSSETFYQIRDNYPVFGLLDGMVVSGDVHLLKPYPEIYRALLDKYALDPSECVFIDDNPANVAGAETVGIRGIRFTGAADLRRILLP
ncbi:MAG: HAD family phosphatase [Bacteroidales bacterium]|nr:HAD family phosphatase [Bacteroidales bacterium]